MMKTALKPDLKSKTFCVSKSYPRLKEKEVCLVNLKYYQKNKNPINQIKWRNNMKTTIKKWLQKV